MRTDRGTLLTSEFKFKSGTNTAETLTDANLDTLEWAKEFMDRYERRSRIQRSNRFDRID